MEHVTYILSLLLALPPAYSDNETWEERQDRMTVIAQAVDDASSKATCTEQYVADLDCKKIWPGSKKMLAQLLVTKGWWESRYAKHVHEGKCKDYECDPKTQPDGSIVHLARSPWQVQKTGYVRRGEWPVLHGASLEATTLAANVAARAFSGAFGRCGTIHGSFSGYGGLSCTWPGVSNRVLFWSKLRDRPAEETKRLIEVQEKAVRAKTTSAR